ncbi:MAG: SnoaL-like domain-containing protein [Leptolyngbyaceae cyanobacterium SM1_3_5]|nr:SnoaL-like domain-containing protein [Leptolyngbyaceae cyanobacterium SM1_3_5]
MTDASEAQTTSATSVDRNAAEPLSIEGLSVPVILRYFEAMNAGDYATVASSFAAEGVMNPPFESSIVGHEAIAAYLDKEARGMLLQPRQGVAQPLDVDTLEVTVTGKVQTPVFGVNVNWIFVLNSQNEIILARIKLIASPQELLSLRR